MPKQSAGILMYRFLEGSLQVFLVHPGGPFFSKKDLGAWTIPKGEFTDDEDPLKAAIREFEEETGKRVSGSFMELEPIRQKGGKMVIAWAIEGNINPSQLVSNTFEMAWPPKSGRVQSFPEVDKGSWFDPTLAKEKINPAQADLIDQLLKRISRPL